MSAAKSEDQYALARSELETKRLNTQHEFIKRSVPPLPPPLTATRKNKPPIRVQPNAYAASYTRSFGYIVHPLLARHCLAAPANPKSDAPIRIADIGTGSGVWLLDLASTLRRASTSLHGFDLSASQFPAPETTPPNVSFHVHDAKQPFPAALHGTFDLIQIRYLVLGLDKLSDWPAVAHNVLALLRPGGGLQWIEGDFMQAMQPLRGDPAATYDADAADADERDAGFSLISRVFKAWGVLFSGRFEGGLQGGWRELGATMRGLGMTGVVEDVVATDTLPEGRWWALHNCIDAWEASMKAAAGRGLAGDLTLEKIDFLVPKMRRFAGMSTYVRHDIHAVVGLKAEEKVG